MKIVSCLFKITKNSGNVSNTADAFVNGLVYPQLWMYGRPKVCYKSTVQLRMVPAGSGDRRVFV